jgi:hypothetical protein
VQFLRTYPSADSHGKSAAYLPLTFQQRWLLGLVRQYPKWNCAAGYTFRLKGVLDLDLLQQSLEEVSRRHGPLRARIVSIDGFTGQCIDGDCPYNLDVVPIHGTSHTEVEANARRAADEIYDIGIELSARPLWTVKLLRLGDREHWLVLVMHRLVAECTSIERVCQDLLSLYVGLKGNCPSAFATMPPQYSDYAVSQQNADGDWVKRHATYWEDHLARAAPVRWPADRDATVSADSSPGKISCPFGMTLSMELRELARKLRVLSATVMLATYAIAVWRWCRQDEFVLPFYVAGRQTEHRPIVGYFSYILHLHVKFSGQETFRQILSRVSNEFYRALAHQDFGRVATQKPGFLAGTLFQWITWHPGDGAQEITQTSDDPVNIEVERVPIRDFGEGSTIVPPDMVDVEITVFDAADGLCAMGTYRADRVTARTMERFMTDLQLTAQRFVHDPDTCVASI